MTTFIMTGKYSTEGIKEISAERTVKGYQIIQQCEGTIRSVYATLGEEDILVIADFPGVDEAMKASISLTQALGISFTTVPAIPVEDFDRLVGSQPA